MEDEVFGRVFARISRQIVSFPIYPPSRSRNHESGRGWLCTVRQWYTAVDGAGERKIKRWQKEWDGKGGREMKRRESVKKRAKKRSYRRWISAYTGFRAAMAVARWNIMLSHRLIFSSRWNSRMSLSPPLVEKRNDWYVIFGYRVMMFPTLLIFLSFSFFWGRERERAFLVVFLKVRFLESNHTSHCPLVDKRGRFKNATEIVENVLHVGMAITVWKGSSRWWPMVYDGGTNSYRIWILNCCTCKAGKLCIWTQEWLVVIYHRLF